MKMSRPRCTIKPVMNSTDHIPHAMISFVVTHILLQPVLNNNVIVVEILVDVLSTTHSKRKGYVGQTDAM